MFTAFFYYSYFETPQNKKDNYQWELESIKDGERLKHKPLFFFDKRD